MAWTAVTCPQCGAPLPRVAIWRSVTCASCGSLIHRSETLVKRETFRQALARAGHAYDGNAGHGILCAGQRYHLVQSLGSGDFSQVYLAQRLGALPFLATIKLSSASAAPARYAQEAQILRELQALDHGTAGAYFSRRLPEVVALGEVEGSGRQHGLVLRYPTDFWGSLADLHARFPRGIDPRHAVWIWRRLLETLSFIHRYGWAHQDVRPEHALVNPQDHGVRLISWASAKRGACAQEQAADLQRSARVVFVLLSGSTATSTVPKHVPAELAQLVSQASEDQDFCRAHGAEGLDGLLRAAARAAYGPPTFVPLIL